MGRAVTREACGPAGGAGAKHGNANDAASLEDDNAELPGPRTSAAKLSFLPA